MARPQNKKGASSGLVAGVVVLFVVLVLLVAWSQHYIGPANTSSSSSSSTTTSSTISTSTTNTITLSSTRSTITGTNPNVGYVFPAVFTDLSCAGSTGCPSGSQITVNVGDAIETQITLSSNVAVVGNLNVNIRESINDLPDHGYENFTNTVHLNTGNTFVTLPTWIVPSQTGSGPFALGQYFITVQFNGLSVYHPTDQSTREYVLAGCALPLAGNPLGILTTTSTSSSSCGTPTSTSTTTTTTTTSTIAGSVQVTINALDQNGNPLASQGQQVVVYLNNAYIGLTPVTTPVIINPTAVNYLMCGVVAGYTTLTPTLSFIETGGVTAINCRYSLTSSGAQTTLAVSVESCSGGGSCALVAGVAVTLTGTGQTTQSQPTDSQGIATFIVATNQAYTASCCTSIGGAVTGIANVGTSPASLVLVNYSGISPLSGLSISEFPGGWFGFGGIVVLAVVVVAFLGIALRKSGTGRGKTKR